MVAIPHLPDSVDRSGLQALLVLTQNALSDVFETIMDEVADDIPEEISEALVSQTVGMIHAAEGELKYADSDGVLAHLMMTTVTPRAEHIANFVREALACGYYLVNGKVYRVEHGIKSTSDTLVAPLSDGTVEIINLDEIFEVDYDADNSTLTIVYEDDEGMDASILELITVRSHDGNKEALLNHGALGPVLSRMQDSIAFIMPVGSQPALTASRKNMPIVQDWLIALDPEELNFKLAAPILSKNGFFKSGFMGCAKGKLKQYKSSPKNGVVVAEIWKQNDVQIFLFEDLTLAQAFGAANDFANRHFLASKELRHAATAQMVRRTIETESLGFDLDSPVMRLSYSSEDRTIEDLDDCRLNAALPLTEQGGTKIRGIPALMRFAYDLLEDAIEEEDFRLTRLSRTVMAFAHTAHQHQTLLVSNSLRIIAERGISYYDDLLEIGPVTIDRADPYLNINLSANRLTFDVSCGNPNCRNCERPFTLSV